MFPEVVTGVGVLVVAVGVVAVAGAGVEGAWRRSMLGMQ
jgi:hypothetical protein